uniref:Protein-export membrane protein SecG n=1 Tax=Candidatus Kentrum sp. FW TaxID=2126338 RepID=A0A450SDR1_9GAMM|nr:MAG: preprotein translocase subunit SecG [Candidatus Kentron sp. FW]
MQQFFMVIHVLTALAVIGLVLIQQGRGADAGAAFGSGASGTLFGSRGPTTFLARVTTILAATFFLTSMALAYMASHSVERESVVEKLQDDSNEEQPGLVDEEEISVPPEPSSSLVIPEFPDSQENPDINTDARSGITDNDEELAATQDPENPLSNNEKKQGK